MARRGEELSSKQRRSEAGDRVSLSEAAVKRHREREREEARSNMLWPQKEDFRKLFQEKNVKGALHKKISLGFTSKL